MKPQERPASIPAQRFAELVEGLPLRLAWLVELKLLTNQEVAAYADRLQDLARDHTYCDETSGRRLPISAHTTPMRNDDLQHEHSGLRV